MTATRGIGTRDKLLEANSLRHHLGRNTLASSKKANCTALEFGSITSTKLGTKVNSRMNFEAALGLKL
jgi:hypothetical protein